MLDYQLLGNEKINYEPFILCNTLFDIVDYKTDIIGFWLDPEGNVHQDNIRLVNYFAIDTDGLQNKKRLLFKDGEKAIFYKDYYNQGVIAYPDGSSDILKNRIAIIEDGKPSEKYIAKLLEFHEGLTIYKIDNGKYLIEIFKA